MDEASDKTQIEPYYQNQAKQAIDIMFDTKMFNPKLTRDDMMALENYLAFLFQINANSAKKSTELCMRFELNSTSK